MHSLSGRSGQATAERIFLMCAVISITAHRFASANTSWHSTADLRL